MASPISTLKMAKIASGSVMSGRSTGGWNPGPKKGSRAVKMNRKATTKPMIATITKKSMLSYTERSPTASEMYLTARRTRMKPAIETTMPTNGMKELIRRRIAPTPP